MKQLKVTDSGPGGKHFVYLNTDTGVGVMTPGKDGHTHEVVYDPPREPVDPTPAMLTDPTTGQQQPAPTTPDGQPDMAQIQQAVSMGLQFTPPTPGDPGKEEGEWIIAPGQTADGEMHEHTMDEYRPNVREKSKESEAEIIADCKSVWKQWRSDESECIKKGRESEDFFANKQWAANVKKALNDTNRAALTINEIAPAIDTLVGYQMEQRTELRYLPQEGGDQRGADILNVVVKAILDRGYYQREKTKVFKDQCVAGKGVLNVGVGFNEDIQGIPFVERFPWDEAVYGPHEKEDLSDCEGSVLSRMESIAWLKQHFGEKADRIQESFANYQGQVPDVGAIDNKNLTSGTNNDYRNAKKIDDVNTTLDGEVTLVDVQKKQFRFVQVTRKTYKPVSVIYNYEDQFFETAYDWDKEDVALAATLPGFQWTSQLRPRMRITKFCGDVVLSDENPADLPVHDFFSVPVYAYRQNGEYWGKVEAAKDPQRELNKRRSQIIDQTNRMAAAVYFTEPQTFINKAEEERFDKKRSAPGSRFKVNDIGRLPHVQQGAEIPVSLVNIMQLDQQNLQRLMNVVIQQGGANESGALFLEKKKAALGGNQFILDNLSFAEQKLGKLMAALVQRYYPAERILRILNSQYKRSKFKIDDKDYSEYSEEEVLEFLDCADFLEYDVIVADSALAPSTRLGIAQMLLEAIQKGAQIPLDLPLEFMDIPADVKARISERMQAQEAAAAQQAQDTSSTEIKKTVLAKGEYTISPEEAQNMGLVPANQNQGLPNEPQNPNNESQAPVDYSQNLSSPLAG